MFRFSLYIEKKIYFFYLFFYCTYTIKVDEDASWPQFCINRRRNITEVKLEKKNISNDVLYTCIAACISLFA